jgi:hypothetical protein
MDVPDETVGPPVEEMFAEGLDAVEDHAVDELGVGGEAALRRGHRDHLSGEDRRVVLGDAVDRMTFGHRHPTVPGHPSSIPLR